MPYTMTRGVSSKPTMYTLKNGFDKRLVERMTKKGFWVLPALVVLGLGLATLTSNQWYGQADKNADKNPKSSLSTNASNSSSDNSSSTPSTWNKAADPSLTSSPAASSTTASAALQTTSPVTNVIGGRGGDSSPSVPSSVSTPTVTPPATTPTPLPVITTPETPPVTPPITTEPVPAPEPHLLCAPDLLGLIPSTCL